MDTQLLPYRLKSARRKKRLQKEDLDKQLLKLDRERSKLWNDPERITIIPLDEPYQRGWKRLFVLKPDVQKSDKAAFYQEILDRINQVQYHHEFKVTSRKKYRGRYKDRLPELYTISRYDWYMNKAKLSDGQRACFHQKHYWDEQYYRWTYKYEFSFPELFRIVILPNIVTTIKLRDISMEKRISYIDDYLDNSGMTYRLYKLKGGRYKYWKGNYDERLKYRNPLKNRAKWDWLDDA